jgi:1-acyl-sn-glycerol-3-phosphate acyltransferase
VLPAIEPGLSKEEFLRVLQEKTEAVCDEFLIEAATGPNPPELPETAMNRLAQLGVRVPG